MRKVVSLKHRQCQILSVVVLQFSFALNYMTSMLCFEKQNSDNKYVIRKFYRHTKSVSARQVGCMNMPKKALCIFQTLLEKGAM